ncbi:uncharacterized protein [Pseudorasbora parva]|uniref:uncharacterized protein n=1 Tax=Pseudorasbora parva TaxID=51549 RepID=UPI00351EAF5B
MAFIKEESEDIKIEATFTVKQEDTEEQKKMAFIKEDSEDMKIEATFTVKQEDTEGQSKAVFIKDESEDIKVEETFRVKPEDTETQTDSCDGTEDGTDGGRKRKDISNWKCVQKRRRMMGQPYVGMSRNEEVNMEPRVMGPRCQSAACVKSSKLHCSTIGEADRENIFKHFWENMNWEEKKMYVRGLVDIIPVKRRRGSENSRRSSTLIFFLEVYGQRRRVCKSLFLATLGIGAWSALNWVQETGNTQKNAASCNRHEAHEFLRSFLQDLPKVSSHFCRSSTSKQYLEPFFQSMMDLYKVYHRAAEEKMLRPFSRQIFSEEFKQQNLSLHRPKKDNCNTCYSYKAGNLPDNEWQVHLLIKEEAHVAKVQDKNAASDKIMVVCMDLQALFCPRLNVSALYCKTKLTVHNFTIYDMSTHKTTCYVWHEGEGALSASEFASCVIDFLSKHKKHEKYILWSDGCGYQNQSNSVVDSALLKFSTEKKKVVIQKFLEKGHTQMECDSVHSVIERRLRNQEIYVPAQYIALMKSARSKPSPYEVKYVDHNFFQDFTKLSLCESIHPGIKLCDPPVHDIRAIRYNINGTMDYKIQHSADWTPFSKRQLQHTTSVTPLYTECLKIKEMKYRHLQDLKEVIPKDFHSFYDNLRH